MNAKPHHSLRLGRCHPSLILLLAIGTAIPSLRESRGGTITGSGPVIGRIFNSPTRQHLQANFRGKGIHRPSGKEGSVNGGFSSLPGQRPPKATLFGAYRVLARANVRYGGGSTSVARQVRVTVRRRTLLIGGIGRIRLTRPIHSTRTGRQNFRGTGDLTIRGV